jgi:hypothetical protein
MNDGLLSHHMAETWGTQILRFNVNSTPKLEHGFAAVLNRAVHALACLAHVGLSAPTNLDAMD